MRRRRTREYSLRRSCFTLYVVFSLSRSVARALLTRDATPNLALPRRKPIRTDGPRPRRIGSAVLSNLHRQSCALFLLSCSAGSPTPVLAQDHHPPSRIIPHRNSSPTLVFRIFPRKSQNTPAYLYSPFDPLWIVTIFPCVAFNPSPPLSSLTSPRYLLFSFAIRISEVFSTHHP